MKLILIFCLIITMSLFTTEVSADNGKINPAGLPAKQEQEPLEVLWKERGERIMIRTVCFNYPAETDEYRGCRILAKKKFGEECGRFKQLYHDSKPYYDKEYEQQMEKYCDADMNFEP